MSINPTSQNLHPPTLPNQEELNDEIQTIHSSNHYSPSELLEEIVSRINELPREATQNLHHVILSSQFRSPRHE